MQLPPSVVSLVLLGALASPAGAAEPGPPPSPTPTPTPTQAAVPAPVDAAPLQASAQAIVDAFAAEVAGARGAPLGPTPVVSVRNTPQLIFFDGEANGIVVPQWEAQPEPMRAVFRTFAGGGDAEAEQLFRAFFNRFLVAHEAAHWFQARAGRTESTLYANENSANQLAVAFWRTQPDGERLLVELEQLAAGAAAALADPTPPGQDPVVFFGENYRALGPDPLKYGYYQFRFMADAMGERSRFDFARMVEEADAPAQAATSQAEGK